jgi:hypothetical protein
LPNERVLANELTRLKQAGRHRQCANVYLVRNSSLADEHVRIADVAAPPWQRRLRIGADKLRAERIYPAAIRVSQLPEECQALLGKVGVGV